MADASHAAEAEVDEARDKVALTVQLTREADAAVTANEDAVDELASITEAIARLAEGAARPLHLRRFLAEESIRGLRSLRASKLERTRPRAIRTTRVQRRSPRSRRRSSRGEAHTPRTDGDPERILEFHHARVRRGCRRRGGLQRAVLGHVARIDSRSLGDYPPHRASTSVRREAALQSDARTSARG
jgi:hypothetical protein